MKVHLFDSDDPLATGGKLKANCGAEIVNAEFAFFFDLNFADSGVANSLRCCRDCRTTRLAKRYVYGIVSGQEALTESVA